MQKEKKTLLIAIESQDTGSEIWFRMTACLQTKTHEAYSLTGTEDLATPDDLTARLQATLGCAMAFGVIHFAVVRNEHPKHTTIVDEAVKRSGLGGERTHGQTQKPRVHLA